MDDTMINPSTEAVRELAPRGVLRAAINFGNPVLAQKEPVSGEPRGVSVDLAHELGRQLNRPVELVAFEAAGRVFEALESDAWDVAFLAIEPARAARVAFSEPYVVIEGTYLVPQSSALRAIDDVDREGYRIAVATRAAYDLFLTRTLKHAEIVRAASQIAALEMVVEKHVDAAAGVRQSLELFARGREDLRLLPGRFMAIEQAMAMPQGRLTGARYLGGFVKEMKVSGFVRDALDRSGQTGAAVAPVSP